MAAISTTYLFKTVAGKVRDLGGGWCAIVRDSDQRVMSVTPQYDAHGHVADFAVEWADPGTFGQYERGIKRDTGVDYWPGGFNEWGCFFGVKEP